MDEDVRQLLEQYPKIKLDKDGNVIIRSYSWKCFDFGFHVLTGKFYLQLGIIRWKPIKSILSKIYNFIPKLPYSKVGTVVMFWILKHTSNE